MERRTRERRRRTSELSRRSSNLSYDLVSPEFRPRFRPCGADRSAADGQAFLLLIGLCEASLTVGQSSAERDRLSVSDGACWIRKGAAELLAHPRRSLRPCDAGSGVRISYRLRRKVPCESEHLRISPTRAAIALREEFTFRVSRESRRASEFRTEFPSKTSPSPRAPGVGIGSLMC